MKIPDTHTAIIDTALWDKAQAVNETLSKWTENAREPHVYLFSGKIFCGDCGVPMMPHSEKRYTSKDKQDCTELRISYSCKTYHVSGRQKCSRHSINEEVLRKFILDNIKRHANSIMLDESRMMAELRKTLIGEISAEKANAQNQLRELKQMLHNLDMKLEKLYEDKVVGSISADTFTNLSAKTEAERSRIAEQVAQLEQSSKETKARMGDIQNWMRLVKENAVVTDIDRSLIDALIERIEIGESAVENGVKVQDVRVVYKFVGVV